MLFFAGQPRSRTPQYCKDNGSFIRKRVINKRQTRAESFWNSEAGNFGIGIIALVSA